MSRGSSLATQEVACLEALLGVHTVIIDCLEQVLYVALVGWVARPVARRRKELGDSSCQATPGFRLWPSARRLHPVRSGVRSVGSGLLTSVLEVLAAHRQLREVEVRVAGEAWSDSGLVFISEVGTLTHPRKSRAASRAY